MCSIQVSATLKDTKGPAQVANMDWATVEDVPRYTHTKNVPRYTHT